MTLESFPSISDTSCNSHISFIAMKMSVFRQLIALWMVKFSRYTPSNCGCVAIHNCRSAALGYSLRMAIFFEHSPLVGPVFVRDHINTFGSKRNTTQLLSSPLRFWIKFSSNSVIVRKNIYISSLSVRQLRNCVNDHLWTNPVPKMYQYIRSSKQTTCLKKAGWISCTVIPHCLSSNRNTLASAVAACLVMQYSPLQGIDRRPK